jgi:hypothetical protein
MGPLIEAVSPDGRWLVIDNASQPDHQVFSLVRLDSGTGTPR